MLEWQKLRPLSCLKYEKSISKVTTVWLDALSSLDGQSFQPLKVSPNQSNSNCFHHRQRGATVPAIDSSPLGSRRTAPLPSLSGTAHREDVSKAVINGYSWPRYLVHWRIQGKQTCGRSTRKQRWVKGTTAREVWCSLGIITKEVRDDCLRRRSRRLSGGRCCDDYSCGTADEVAEFSDVS